VRRFTFHAIRGTAITRRAIPNQSATAGFRRPVGSARIAVRGMSASTSRSRYMFSVVPLATIRVVSATAQRASARARVPGATRMPTAVVKITSVASRGLVRPMRSTRKCGRSDMGRLGRGVPMDGGCRARQPGY
jgi:hypothetical protein